MCTALPRDLGVPGSRHLVFSSLLGLLSLAHQTRCPTHTAHSRLGKKSKDGEATSSPRGSDAHEHLPSRRG
ncbi:uncharacterized protein B0T23DRAFT_382265 [Neurospora hispaniola]|uniref:Uncharacterized protein n=1 Tax=Neurospora hispaniola TaxID=588809 RepID=A0AAJ0MQG8_9PEZI|nr:hypothetical protein B0T23DRAFT_382265 [Neurospora hispaniola]